MVQVVKVVKVVRVVLFVNVVLVVQVVQVVKVVKVVPVRVVPFVNVVLAVQVFRVVKMVPARRACAPVARRRCPHSGEGEDFLTRRPFFFYENSRNSKTKSKNIAPNVGNEPSLRGLQTGR